MSYLLYIVRLLSTTHHIQPAQSRAPFSQCHTTTTLSHSYTTTALLSRFHAITAPLSQSHVTTAPHSQFHATTVLLSRVHIITARSSIATAQVQIIEVALRKEPAHPHSSVTIATCYSQRKSSSRDTIASHSQPIPSSTTPGVLPSVVTGACGRQRFLSQKAWRKDPGTARTPPATGRERQGFTGWRI